MGACPYDNNSITYTLDVTGVNTLYYKFECENSSPTCTVDGVALTQTVSTVDIGGFRLASAFLNSLYSGSLQLTNTIDVSNKTFVTVVISATGTTNNFLILSETATPKWAFT